MDQSTPRICKSRVPLSINQKIARIPWLFSLLIILLPKCSLCFAAYTGAIAMCSGKNMMGEMDGTGTIIMLGLALSIIWSMAHKRRGIRTYQSIFVILISLTLIFLNHFEWLGPIGYYVGSIGLFLGIWTNGSLYYVLGNLKDKYQILKI